MSESMSIAWPHFVAVAMLTPLFLALRFYPIWPRRFQGCDAYNILLTAEYLRKTKRLPICLPLLFMLENQEQWYPPGFLVLCALLPQSWLKRRYWAVNHLTDLGSALLVYGAAAWLGASVWAAFLAALFYGAVAGLVSEFASLNVRPLGLLLFNALMLAGFAATQNPWWLIAAAALATALFFSHKLSVQQLWFTLPALSLVCWTWIWVAILGFLYAVPFVLWPRGAWRVLRGHGVIVRFWHRNWRLLGAHSVRQSPVYGDGETRTDFYAGDSWQGAIAFAKDALHQNYFILPVIVVAVSHAAGASPSLVFLSVWIGTVYLSAMMIHFIKMLRGIGLGRQYFKFAVAPSLVVTALGLTHDGGAVLWSAALLAAVLTARQYWLVARLMRRTADMRVGVEDADLEQLMSHLADDRDARILVLPVHLCDLVAYRTRRPVYWGTHSDVFDERLEAFFPVLKHELAYYAHDGANRVLLDTAYASPSELHLPDTGCIERCGRYAVYRLDPSVRAPSNAGPLAAHGTVA